MFYCNFQLFSILFCLDCAANFDANVFQTSLINIKKSQDHTNSSSLTNFLTFFNLCWQQHLPKESSHWYQVVKCHVFQQCYSKLSLNTFAIKRNKCSFIIFGNNFCDEGRFGFLQSRILNIIIVKIMSWSMIQPQTPNVVYWILTIEQLWCILKMCFGCTFQNQSCGIILYYWTFM